MILTPLFVFEDTEGVIGYTHGQIFKVLQSDPEKISVCSTCHGLFITQYYARARCCQDGRPESIKKHRERCGCL